MRIFTIFSTPSYFLNSDKRFENCVQNTIHVFGFEKKQFFSKLLLNHNDFAKTFNILEIWLSRAFQRYITRPIPTKKIKKVFELNKTIF